MRLIQLRHPRRVVLADHRRVNMAKLLSDYLRPQTLHKLPHREGVSELFGVRSLASGFAVFVCWQFHAFHSSCVQHASDAS